MNSRAKLPEAQMSDEQPTIALIYNRSAIMPDGSIGCVSIGEFAGDRSKELHITVSQAITLANQILERIGKK